MPGPRSSFEGLGPAVDLLLSQAASARRLTTTWAKLHEQISASAPQGARIPSPTALRMYVSARRKRSKPKAAPKVAPNGLDAVKAHLRKLADAKRDEAAKLEQALALLQ